MSTRALYTFKGSDGDYTFKGSDGDQDWNVYKHSDGFPSGAAVTLLAAQQWFAWKVPRYESDEFACAFIAAAKAFFLLNEDKMDTQNVKYHPGGVYNAWSGGGVRLMPQGDPATVATEQCGDIEYRYEVYEKKVRGKPELWIKAFNGSWWHKLVQETVIIDCSLVDFPQKARDFDDKRHAAAVARIRMAKGYALDKDTFVEVTKEDNK